MNKYKIGCAENIPDELKQGNASALFVLFDSISKLNTEKPFKTPCTSSYYTTGPDALDKFETFDVIYNTALRTTASDVAKLGTYKKDAGKWLCTEKYIETKGDFLASAPAVSLKKLNLTRRNNNDNEIICVIDIDHCIDEQGHINDFASNIITHFDSYTEISMSGTGIHIAIFIDDDINKLKLNNNNAIDKIVSDFDFMGSCAETELLFGTFIVLTGNVYNNKKIIEHRNDKYLQFLQYIKKDTASNKKNLFNCDTSDNVVTHPTPATTSDVVSDETDTNEINAVSLMPDDEQHKMVQDVLSQIYNSKYCASFKLLAFGQITDESNADDITKRNYYIKVDDVTSDAPIVSKVNSLSQSNKQLFNILQIFVYNVTGDHINNFITLFHLVLKETNIYKIRTDSKYTFIDDKTKWHNYSNLKGEIVRAFNNRHQYAQEITEMKQNLQNWLLNKNKADDVSAVSLDDTEIGTDFILYELNDNGMSDAFIKRYFNTYRFNYANNEWYKFNKYKWDVVMLSDLIDSYNKMRIEMKLNTDEKSTIKFLTSTGTTKKAKDVIEMSKGTLKFPNNTKFKFDDDPYSINTRNGIVHLPTGTISTESNTYWHKTVKANLLQDKINMPDDEIAPTFAKFIKDITSCDNDPAKSQLYYNYVMSMCATFLYGKKFFKCCYFLFGPANTGKSVLIDILKYILDDYCRPMPDDLVIKRKATSTFNTSQVANTRLLFTSELNIGEIDTGKFKTVTSTCDTLDAPQKYVKENAVIKTNFNMLIATNDLPPFAPDDAMADRFKIIKMQNIYKDKNKATGDDKIKDEKLPEKLQSESDAIFTLLCKYAKAFAKNDFQLPYIAEMDDVYKENLLTNNNIGIFISNYYDINISCDEFIEPTKNVYVSYTDYCQNANIKALEKNKFFKVLYKIFPELKSITRRDDFGATVRYIKGIKEKAFITSF